MFAVINCHGLIEMKALSKNRRFISLLLLVAFCFCYSAESVAYSTCQHQQNKNLQESTTGNHACCIKQKKNQARKQSCHTKSDSSLTENRTVIESINPFEASCYHCLSHGNSSSQLTHSIAPDSTQKKAGKVVTNSTFFIQHFQQEKSYESVIIKKPLPIINGQNKHVQISVFLI